MKPRELNRVLECDDGIFNVKWGIDYPKYKDLPCGYLVPGGGGVDCERSGEFWCTTCGLVVCKKHRKNHDKNIQHRLRREKYG